MSQTPTVSQAIRAAVEARLVDVHTSMPGKVVAYNPITRRASVQPLLRRGFVNEEGSREAESLPVVTEVPIMFQGSGGARERFPIHVGDTVLLVFMEGSLDRWLHKGDEGDSGDDRRHNLTDAVAIPGLQHAATDAGVMIEFTETEILAGGSSPLATKADIDALITTFNAHVHTGVTTGPGSSGAPGTPAAPAVGTTVLKGS